MTPWPYITLSRLRAVVLTSLLLTTPLTSAAPAAPVDGQFPPGSPAGGEWQSLLTGQLTDQWTGMSMAIDSPLISTRPDPDRPGHYILHIDRGPTGLIRSIDVFENFILELEWRHLGEAPSAGGSKTSSGNSGLLIAHSAFAKPGGPYPGEGHEIQVCNLGNGSWYTSHGDLFTLPGSISTGLPDPRFVISHACGHRSMPTEFRGSKTGEWNKVRLTCMDGLLEQEVNGALVTALHRISPRRGYMSFESEGGAVEFRAMRLLPLPADPELAPRHIAPLLPEPMAGHYFTQRSPVPLPQGNFIASADITGSLPLSTLISGLDLPATPVTGRVTLAVRDGLATITQDGQPVGTPCPMAATAAPVWHLDAPGAKLGHTLLLTPVGKK
jgi:Domain of Unknown Function (DUF1080)